ncbi:MULTISPECIES: class I SAM-dependent methyltransferase [Methylomonas]|uniref:Ubiquinone biosynthesis protein UbiE n=2 Tax=Methylomonas TaxID=416 RepID=A0A126T871_9GAMM|nr:MULTISPECIES: class I SAM-dependent methyltransferase [Methylomonas]AMK77964.1 ubiquinone biosynthesis protein UbiE [Methylomonas denitrificans]OAI07732.1 ubiquinone biosynthesis protein UbiE [Methylomonas methanica]TCV85498.1 methyltransferase family protein [Methylomonas methanica]
MTADKPFDAMFSGVIGQEYQMLKLICPFATEMSRLVGEIVGAYCDAQNTTQTVVELGGGTGITTLAILSAADNLRVLSVDNEPTMQSQAKQSLRDWIAAGRLSFSSEDALTALQALASESVDILASAYTLHNFHIDYRRRVLAEIYRVLKPGGKFVNGDRYALDDISAHTRSTQREVGGYFKVLTEINRLDLLEHWIVHLFNDESENHVMRESVALAQMADAGFRDIDLQQRMEVNALVTAVK